MSKYSSIDSFCQRMSKIITSYSSTFPSHRWLCLLYWVALFGFYSSSALWVILHLNKNIIDRVVKSAESIVLSRNVSSVVRGKVQSGSFLGHRYCGCPWQITNNIIFGTIVWETNGFGEQRICSLSKLLIQRTRFK